MCSHLHRQEQQSVFDFLSAMLARIKAVAGFINTSREITGNSAAHQSLQKDHVDQLVQFINAEPICNVQDSTAALQALTSDAVASAFTEEQRHHMASALSSHSMTCCAPGAPKKSPAQSHYHMQHYLTASDWKTMDTRRSDDVSKVHMLLERAHAIGLVYPSELTVAAIVSITKLSCHVQDQTILFYVQEYKRLNKLRRVASMRTMTTYPRDPAEFLQEYPNAYGDDKPVMCPYDDMACDSARATTAARKTHRSIANAPASSSMQHTAMGQLDAFATAIMRHVGMKQLPQITYLQPPPPSGLRTPLSLQDSQGDCSTPSPGLLRTSSGLPPGSEETPLPPTPANGGKSPDALSTAIADVERALAAKRDAAGNKKKAGKKTPAAMKKPAAAAATSTGKASSSGGAKKRPAAATGDKKPTISIVKTRNQVVARTGLHGEGSAKVFRYETCPAKAQKEAAAWLRSECESFGIDCPY